MAIFRRVSPETITLRPAVMSGVIVQVPSTATSAANNTTLTGIPDWPDRHQMGLWGSCSTVKNHLASTFWVKVGFVDQLILKSPIWCKIGSNIVANLTTLYSTTRLLTRDVKFGRAKMY